MVNFGKNGLFSFSLKNQIVTFFSTPETRFPEKIGNSNERISIKMQKHAFFTLLAKMANFEPFFAKMAKSAWHIFVAIPSPY